MAEWLGRGLQNLVHRFNSGSRLQLKSPYLLAFSEENLEKGLFVVLPHKVPFSPISAGPDGNETATLSGILDAFCDPPSNTHRLGDYCHSQYIAVPDGNMIRPKPDAWRD
jgi:hypothetical protein